jgi:hypothetical protein
MSAANPALEDVLRIADQAASRKLVAEAVRTAYALGKFDGIIECTRRQIEERQKARQVLTTDEQRFPQ